MPDIQVTSDGEVGIVRLTRGPHNFFDADLVSQISAALADMEGERSAAVLCAEGRNFCAGADVTKRGTSAYARDGRHLYDHALDLFRSAVPLVAAVQGKAVGGGLGLALVADLRVGNADTTFIANFVSLGIHPGFGISATLPALVGAGRAGDMLLTSRSVSGEEALRFGLLDRLVEEGDLLPAALAVAHDIAASPANATRAVRSTLRSQLLETLPAVMAHERREQDALIAANLQGG